MTLKELIADVRENHFDCGKDCTTVQLCEAADDLSALISEGATKEHDDLTRTGELAEGSAPQHASTGEKG